MEGMDKKVLLLLIVVLHTAVALAEPVIRGKVVDATTGGEIIGATVQLKGTTDRWAVTGLDGSFSIDVKVHSGTLVCSLIGYKDMEVLFNDSGEELSIPMEPDVYMLEAAVVTATGAGRTEMAARTLPSSQASDGRN